MNYVHISLSLRIVVVLIIFSVEQAENYTFCRINAKLGTGAGKIDKF